MLFSEIYGTYYHTIAKILTHAVEGRLDRQTLYDLVQRYGFEESMLTIPQGLHSQSWPLLAKDYTTPLAHTPTMPLTTLQKQWLKALLQDPRVQLFDPPMEGLEHVQPLYPADAFVYFDRYEDGDPYEDPDYIKRFRCIRKAIAQKRWLQICFAGSGGKPHVWRCIPYRLEYSPKDDKFRLISANRKDTLSINLARIRQCQLLEPCTPEEYNPRPMRQQTLVLELQDIRNALERVMLHFSYLDKETQRLQEDRYRITLRYDAEDEAELLIRVLSFGPALQVISPDSFAQKLKDRLTKQKNLWTQV